MIMKTLKIKLGIFSLLAMITASVFLISCEQEAILQNNSLLEELNEQDVTIGERIIIDYINEKRQKLPSKVSEKGSQDYLDFLFEVGMGDYPDLTGKGSKYVKSSEELNSVIDFVMQERASLYNNYPADDIQDEKEAITTRKGELSSKNFLKSGVSYNRDAARDYAIIWAYGRNSNYPDFSTAGGGGDCTNFVSQAVHHGGIDMQGSGDGCKHENNYSEWYVEAGGGWSCFGDWNSWEWATPWSVTWPFRYYHVYEADNAVAGWTKSASTADWFLNIGDVVQIQQWNGSYWSTYHTMIVTADIYNDLKVTYHSDDMEGKKLSTIPLGNNRRFMCVKFE